MPSATFYHLPAEKREKLLRAARAEFARVPFAQASINQIVRAAGIPRGSFYMYFEDKEDVFRYLLSEYGERMAGLLEEALSRRGGDIFESFLDVFDAILDDHRTRMGEHAYEEVLQILRHNHDLKPDLFMEKRGCPNLIRRIGAGADRELLSIRKEGDLETMLYILIGVTGPAIMNAILAEDPERVRASYIDILEILQRGMAKAPDCAASH